MNFPLTPSLQNIGDKNGPYFYKFKNNSSHHSNRTVKHSNVLINVMPHPQAMSSFRRNLNVKFHPRVGKFDQLFVLNATSFHFHALVSGLLIL